MHLALNQSTSDVQDVLDTMRYQETVIYARSDYLSREDQVPVIDAKWRQNMLTWMYSVIDHCQLRRDSVSVAAHYLDLLMGHGAIHSRDEYQIASMASLQLAIKLHDSTMVKLDSMVKLGRGLFTEDDVVGMEQRILKTLKWQVNPPTPVCFLRQLLLLLPESVSSLPRYSIAELSRFIIEVSVCVYQFVKYRPSIVALAAMILAMSRVDDHSIAPEQKEMIIEELASTLKVRSSDPELIEAIDFLRASLDRNSGLQELLDTIDTHCQEEQMKQSEAFRQTETCHTYSPRDVSHTIPQ